MLLVVAINDHRVRFEVGYGYEGVFSDVIAGRIIRNYITPNFRSENYYLGIKSGIEAAIQIVSGEPIENIESTNNVLFLKVLQMPFVGVYLAIFILSYMYNLVFGTRLRKIKINKDIKKAKENKISSKKSNKPRGHKIKRKTLMRLNDFLQYKYFFPTFSNMAPMMIVLTLLVIFFVQVAYDGEVTPITVMAMVFLDLFLNLLILPLLLGVLGLAIPIARRQKKEWALIAGYDIVHTKSLYSSSSSRRESDYSGSYSSSSSSSSSGGGGGSSGGGGASGSW